jgi:ubiquitin C-terminal hydrolase
MNFSPVPLKNLKNTCYINCALQVFSLCVSYSKTLLVEFESHSNPKNFIKEFTSILQVLNSQKSDSLSLVSFINLSDSTFGFSRETQEDIVEYLEKIIDFLVSEIPETSSFFKGTLTTRLTCRSCQTTRYSPQAFFTLGISIPPMKKLSNFSSFCKKSKKFDLSLENCIADFFYKEKYEDIDCERCGTVFSHVVENIFDGTGEFFFLFLKRYKNQRFFKKDYSNVRLSQYLNLEVRGKEEVQRFKLIGVVEHTDYIFFGGHYTCYVNRGMSWYYINDDKVKRSTWEQVSKAQAYLILLKKCQNNRNLNDSIIF